MRYWVGCTITTVSTNLSCDIQIGQLSDKEKMFQMDWEKIGGQLDLRFDDGRWFNFAPNKEHKGIVIFPHKNDESAGAYNDTEILVTLFGVPERFAEKLGCGEYFYGDGKIFLTNEDARWKMWYPCV